MNAGKTNRLVMEAAKRAMEGNKVYVVVVKFEDIDPLRRRFLQEAKAKPNGANSSLKIGAGEIRFLTESNGTVSKAEKRVVGVPIPNTFWA